MAGKAEGIGAALLLGLLIVGGVMVGSKLLDDLMTFPCPICGSQVAENTPQCSRCRSRLNWAPRR